MTLLAVVGCPPCFSLSLAGIERARSAERRSKRSYKPELRRPNGGRSGLSSRLALTDKILCIKATKFLHIPHVRNANNSILIVKDYDVTCIGGA